jgi:predicted ATPase/tRNA A-37 threonylcarbamoyl transferase component Bud32
MQQVIQNPQLIGKRYELGDMIGLGGMGAVYRAHDLLTGHYIALKRVLSEGDAGDMNESFRLALTQEFKLMASFHHPYIIEVIDYGFDESRHPYYTMELLQNTKTILEATHNQSITLKLTYLLQLLQALMYLHRRGVLHRDLKPANVLVVDNKVRVLDFGLSVMRDRATASSEDVGQTAGTLAYISPEVLRGAHATEASDLYAVGVIAYEMFKGEHPFPHQEVAKLINDVLFRMPDISQLDVGYDISSVIERLMMKDPDDRYTNAGEAINALKYAIQEPIDIDTTATRDSFLQAARLVGRDKELGQLALALADAGEGRGSSWLISGESGVGKSRLIDELRTLALVNGALAMRGQAINEGRTPYQLWRNIFRWLGLVGELDMVDAGLIKLLVPDIVSLPPYYLEAAAELESTKVQSRLLNALERMIKALGRPVLIMLEDIHWAGSENVSLFAALSQLAEKLPLLLLASFRDDERPDIPNLLPNSTILKLNRLNESDIAELSQAMLGEVGTKDQVVHLLQRETEGNVFFLIEVVRALAEEAGNLEEIGRTTLPQSVFAGGVQKIIERRLDRISSKMHDILGLAGVIGRQVDINLLRYIAPNVDINTFLNECANAAVLEVLDGEWRFAHDKLRDGVLERIPRRDLMSFHRRVAEGLEKLYGMTENVAALAHHWGMVGDVVKEEQYTSLAGEQSLRSGAYQEAVIFFERALSLITPKAQAQKESLLRRVYLEHRKAEAYLGFGAYTQARQLYQESLQISEKNELPEGIASSLFALGSVEHVRGLYEAARKYYQRSLEIYRQLDKPAEVVKLLNSLGSVAYDMGDDKLAKELYQQSLTLSRELGGQWGMAGTSGKLDTIVVKRVENGDESNDKRRTLMSALMDYSARGDKVQMARIYYELGNLSYELREYDEATQAFSKAQVTYKELGDSIGIINTYLQLGRVFADEKNYGVAHANFIMGLKVAKDANQSDAIFSLLNRLAHLYVAQNHLGDALKLISFMAHAQELPDQMEDEIEEFTFNLQAQVDDALLKTSWEQGKQQSLAMVLLDILGE